MVRILEKRLGRLLTFNEAKDRITQKLMEQKKENALNHLIRNSLSRSLVWTVFDQGSDFEMDLEINTGAAARCNPSQRFDRSQQCESSHVGSRSIDPFAKSECSIRSSRKTATECDGIGE